MQEETAKAIQRGQELWNDRSLGTPQDYAKLARHIIENDMLNGEVIRLAPR